MGAMPSRAQSELYKGLLPVELSIEAPAVYAADLENDRFANEQPSFGKRASRPLARFLITFYLGVAATLAWQSYSDPARQIIASSSPQLGWLAPQAAVAKTVPNTIEQITMRIVDRIATSIAAAQEQITRSVDQLAAGQEQMTREINELQTVEQYVLDKISTPAPRPAPIPISKPVLRPSQAPIRLTPAKNP